MAFTFDTSTDTGKVRLLIPDRVDSGHIFEDADITALLSIEGSNLKRTVALALETIASDTAMTLKVMKLLDLQTDGAATSKALLERAALLRNQATDEESREDGGAFDIAQSIGTVWGYREYITNELLKT